MTLETIQLIHTCILIGLFIFGYLIGRIKKQDAYEKRMKLLEVDKEYWRAIASRQKAAGVPEPPNL